MGGPDKVKRQHDAGRLTVRERIDALLDPGSFHEISGALASRADMTKTANSNRSSRPISCSAAPHRGRPVVVGGDDFTVRRQRCRCGDPARSR
jgi:acetyl-CoA carboxylase carboxyltransferase component